MLCVLPGKLWGAAAKRCKTYSVHRVSRWFLRRRQGLTQEDLCRRTGISRATICKLERGGGATFHPEIVGKLLAYFGREAADAFPEGKNGVDHFVPVTDFGSWLRNCRVRKGLQQVEIAKMLGVCKASVSAYERNQTRPRDVILKRLKKAFRLNGEFEQFLRLRTRGRR